MNRSCKLTLILMHTKKTNLHIFAILILLVTLAASCTSYKRVPMIQNSAEMSSFVDTLHTLRIKPKDQLFIRIINTLEPLSTRIFNLQSYSTLKEDGKMGYSAGQALRYEVDNEGNIIFPTLGTLHVAGMTRDQLANFIADQVYGAYLKDRPEVVVRIDNFHVSVIGQVAHPGQYSFNSDPVTIFDALSKASDMEIHGRRYNVKVLRENDKGEKTVGEIDLTDANCLRSPYYYLQQNDIVYVEPNTAMAKQSGVGLDTQYWFRAASVLLSVVSLTYRIVK